MIFLWGYLTLEAVHKSLPHDRLTRSKYGEWMTCERQNSTHQRKGSTTEGSVEVLFLVAVNSCQVSLLGRFHSKSSLETADSPVASQQAWRLYQWRQAQKQREWCGSERGDGAFAGFTPTHMPQQISQLRLHLTLDMQLTKQTRTEGWEGCVRRRRLAKREGMEVGA